ncbi:XdhC family protein [Radiobacillus sp. PE A8.2]|uniref:XdhC family protein n=1 Tax=Radiobacillus sp. PE A8.2 TaxID=3380349 RepID=UPI00388E1523
MEDMHKILDHICSSPAGGVLATIIRVEGSAYKKEGAMMVWNPDGTAKGLLSAGCLEEDLAVRIENGAGKKTETICYDMRSIDELSWGEGSGCNGVIEVLLEPVDQLLHQHLRLVKEFLDEGKAVTMVKQLATDGTRPNYSFITETKEIFSCMEGTEPTNVQSLRSLGNGKGYSKELLTDVYVHHIEPKQRLFVFGAGKDSIPLVEFAAKSGFDVTVLDWRPALCQTVNFPHASKLIVGFPEQLLENVHLTDKDYVVILTHNFMKDKQLLDQLLEHDLRYLGVLGSKRRTARLLGCKQEEIPGAITTPVGLSIDAQGPEEIAISIVAQLIQVSKQTVIKQAEVS